MGEEVWADCDAVDFSVERFLTPSPEIAEKIAEKTICKLRAWRFVSPQPREKTSTTENTESTEDATEGARVLCGE